MRMVLFRCRMQPTTGMVLRRSSTAHWRVDCFRVQRWDSYGCFYWMLPSIERPDTPATAVLSKGLVLNIHVGSIWERLIATGLV